MAACLPASSACKGLKVSLHFFSEVPGKRLVNLEERQEGQERKMEQLTVSLKNLQKFLQWLNNSLEIQEYTNTRA